MYLVPDGDWVYYSEWKSAGNSKKQDTTDDKFLCRVKKDGSEKQELNSVPSGDINVYNDRVYYTNWTENNIYSMSLDGTDNKKLTDEYGVYINIAFDKLYIVQYDDSNKPVSKSIDLADGE
jgi:hypothetical protein